MANALPLVSIPQLQYLVAVADHDTWAEAAASVGVSASALSQGLSELQKRVGVQLFDQVGRRRVFQASAEPVVDYARRVLADTADLAQWASDFRAGATGPLRVGMIDVAAVQYYSKTLQAFRADHPEVELLLRVAPSGELLDLARQGSIDVAVCVAPSAGESNDIDQVDLFDEPLLLYAPAGEARTPAGKARSPRTWGPWVTFPQGSHSRRLIASAVRAAGSEFEVVGESNQPEVLCEMVRLGLGWTVLPAAQAESGAAPLTPARPEPVTHRKLVLARRSKRSLAPAAQTLSNRLFEAIPAVG